MKTIIRLRWWIFGLLMLLNLVNNFDRQVFALVAPTLQKDMGWSEVDYGRMIAAFQISFAIMNLGLGGFIDKFGARMSLGLAIFWFSVAQIAHVLVRGPMGFLVARVGLAIGEAPVYPASLKALAEWAPASERSIGAGIMHFGVMLGAIVAPLIIPWMTVHWGWESGFVLTGILGFIVLIPWMVLYFRPEDHKRLSPEERSLILSGRRVKTSEKPAPWIVLFKRRELWVYVASAAMVNPAWWFMTYWLPKFLGESYGIHGVGLTPYVTTVYAIAAVGALAGGSLSGLLLKRNFSVNAARKTTLLICGGLMPLVIIAAFTHSAWVAVLLIGMAAVVHQTWTATSAAILADLFPPRAVASVVGIGSFFGSIAGVIGAEVTGHVLAADKGNYAPMFIYAGCAYLLAVGVIHLLSPRLEPVKGI